MGGDCSLAGPRGKLLLIMGVGHVPWAGQATTLQDADGKGCAAVRQPAVGLLTNGSSCVGPTCQGHHCRALTALDLVPMLTSKRTHRPGKPHQSYIQNPMRSAAERFINFNTAASSKSRVLISWACFPLL